MEPIEWTGPIGTFALVAIPLIALAVFALFEPWKWPEKLRKAAKRRQK